MSRTREHKADGEGRAAERHPEIAKRFADYMQRRPLLTREERINSILDAELSRYADALRRLS